MEFIFLQFLIIVQQKLLLATPECLRKVEQEGYVIKKKTLFSNERVDIYLLYKECIPFLGHNTFVHDPIIVLLQNEKGKNVTDNHLCFDAISLSLESHSYIIFFRLIHKKL